MIQFTCPFPIAFYIRFRDELARVDSIVRRLNEARAKRPRCRRAELLTRPVRPFHQDRRC